MAALYIHKTPGVQKFKEVLKEDALLIAKNAAQFLIEQSRPEGDRLEFFPPTYYGDKLAFAKAKALIDNLTVVQNITNGQIPTTFDLRDPERNKKRSYWINCSNASITILLRMAELTGEE